MAKKIDMVKTCAESCVLLTVTYDHITTRAYRPTNGAAVVQELADTCKEHGTQGQVVIDCGVWRTVAEFDGADIWVDYVIRHKGHYRRRNADKARRF